MLLGTGAYRRVIVATVLASLVVLTIVGLVAVRTSSVGYKRSGIYKLNQEIARRKGERVAPPPSALRLQRHILLTSGAAVAAGAGGLLLLQRKRMPLGAILYASAAVFFALMLTRIAQIALGFVSRGILHFPDILELPIVMQVRAASYVIAGVGVLLICAVAALLLIVAAIESLRTHVFTRP